jgi:hypothetical protein
MSVGATLRNRRPMRRLLGEHGNAGRVVLREDAAALRQAYALLSKIADRLSMDDAQSDAA